MTPYVTLAAWNEMTPAERRASLRRREGAPRRFNRQTGDAIDWAKWTWNPVTGCLHTCPYCYARDIAQTVYPTRFEPTFWPSKLAAPSATRPPTTGDVSYRNVFTCSMADLFGRWVPAEWIRAVLDEVDRHPEWHFLFLTKFPKRLGEFLFPRNAWVGTSVDTQERVKNAEDAFARLQGPAVKWLSIEPMLEPLRFTRLHLFDWVVIGGASKSSQTPASYPPVAWWEPLQAEVERLGAMVYHKTNLYPPGRYARRMDFPHIDPAAPETVQYALF